MRTPTEIELALADGGGVLLRRDHLQLAAAINYAQRSGRLKALLPGVYVDAGRTVDLELQIRALMAWNPDAVVVGRAAARLTFWPELAVVEVEAATRRVRFTAEGYHLVDRRIDPELVVERAGVRLAAPPLTALDLSPSLGGDPIDAVLRSRQATLADLRRAMELSPGRSGNRRRHELLVDSRDAPWSAIEREAHRVFRAAGLCGWRTNYPVTVGGHRYFLDVAFPEARLAIEIDGRAFHGPSQFESDRARQNALVLDGWTVLRFTAAMIRDDPTAVVAAILRVLDAAAAFVAVR